MCDMWGSVTFVKKILTEQNFSFKLTIFIQFPSQVKYIEDITRWRELPWQPSARLSVKMATKF